MPLFERDVEVTYVKAGGPGGQHRNKRETGVRLHHKPTGIVVTASERRERPQNLALAWWRLRREIERREYRPPTRRKTKPTRSSVERRLKDKARRGRTKQSRRSPSEE